MKNTIIYSFVFLLLFYQIKDGIIVAGFKMNQDYIAQTLCENKNRPELNCKGNCVFMKAIAESHKHDKGFPALKLGGKFSFFISSPKIIQEFKLEDNKTLLIHSAFYLLKAYKNAEFSVFHPPQLV